MSRILSLSCAGVREGESSVRVLQRRQGVCAIDVRQSSHSVNVSLYLPPATCTWYALHGLLASVWTRQLGSHERTFEPIESW